MDSITFKNYRQFKDETTFDLKNINILVGKNNSGKSTLTKGLRLYLYNLKNLKLDHTDINNAENINEFEDVKVCRYKPFFLFGGGTLDNPHVGTFGRALSRDSEDDYILFSVRMGHIVIETMVSRYYKDSDGNQVDCFDRTSAPISRITICDDNMVSRYIFDFKKNIQTIEIDARENSTHYRVWEKCIEEIQSRYRLFNGRIFDEGDKMRMNQYNLYLTIKHKAFIKFEVDLYHHVDNPRCFTDGSLFSSLLDDADYNCAYNYDLYYDDTNPMLNELANQHIDENTGCDYRFDFLEDVCTKTKDDLNRYIDQAQIEYIEAHSVTHSIVYNGSDKNDYMAQTILDYLNENIKADDPEKAFIEDWMMKFEIGEDFEIESIGGECFKLGIIEDVDHPKEITPLLDKGVGSNQMMILLLQLATIMHKNRETTIPPMIIIEEPEQNLHPQMQSFLADLFFNVYAYPPKTNKKSCGISFLIETHSEYLVRKTQVIVANREDEKPNPFIVYYLETGNAPRQICYQNNGVFYNDFGEGFYDTAVSLTEQIV